MKNTKSIIVSLSFLLTVVSAVAIHGQTTSDRYVISAKAGGVNFVTGDVKTTKKASTEAAPASIREALENGDEIRTGADGRVEVLLNPGSYLRLGPNSALEIIDTSLDSLRLRLTSGDAIFEVSGDDDEIAPVEIDVANASVVLEKQGIYRVQYREPEIATVRVQKGRVRIGDEKISEGKEIVIDRGTQVAVAEFDKKEQDDFAEWSATRAKTIAEANAKLSKDSVSSLSSRYRNGLSGRRRGFSGYWLYDPFFGGRTFLPFYSRWSSPYGHRYHRGFGFSHSWFRSFGRPSVRIHRSYRPVVIRHPVKHGGRRH